MQRLSEEVQGRLQEMALITARTLGIELDPNAVAIYDPTHRGEALHSDGSTEIVIVASPDPDGGVTFGCYIDPPGICIPC